MASLWQFLGRSGAVCPTCSYTLAFTTYGVNKIILYFVCATDSHSHIWLVYLIVLCVQGRLTQAKAAQVGILVCFD